MRLISKHHDYYDGLVRCTVNDPTYVFVRNEEKIPSTSYRLFSPDSCDVDKYHYSIYYGVVGFCGQLYPFVDICKSVNNVYNDSEPSESIYCYTYDQVKSILPTSKLQNKKKWYRSYGIVSNIKSWFAMEENSSFMKKKNEWIHDKLSLFEQYDMAYFTIVWQCGEFVIYKYPTLKDVEFYKVFDSATTFQKIEQYLTNDLVKPDKIEIEISDDLKRDTHGFNNKSFRKDPTKKKKRK